MAIKHIADLTSVTRINDSDVLVIDDGEHNYKITWQAVKTLLGTVFSFAADPDTEHYPGQLKLVWADGTVLRAKASDPDKQDKLTFDATPTQNSDNPVKSGGIFIALGKKFDKDDYIAFRGASAEAAGQAGIVPAPAATGLYLGSGGAWEQPDAEPTQGSGKLITSGAVAEALANISIDVDDTMSETSKNPVQNKVVTAKMKSTAQADKVYHLGFYLDSNGDLCYD